MIASVVGITIGAMIVMTAYQNVSIVLLVLKCSLINYVNSLLLESCFPQQEDNNSNTGQVAWYLSSAD